MAIYSRMRAGPVVDNQTVIFAGSYDRGKPRVRLLLAGARAVGYQVVECHVDIWGDVEDKSTIRGFIQAGKYALRWISAYPKILFRYCRAPHHQKVLIPYPGVFDLLILYPAIKCRGATIYLDIFFSLYDATINDRKLIQKKGVVAKLLYVVEWLASRMADVTFFDTEVHGMHLLKLFNLSEENIKYVLVGVETGTFRRREYSLWQGNEPLTVLFYGQFIPLQGTQTLLDAIISWEGAPRFPIRWIIVGQGQDSTDFDEKVSDLGLTTVQRIDWVPYRELPNLIADADICCGIFGASQKALSVIPNKIYQVLAVGRPIITADTPGIRSILRPGPAVELVLPGDAMAIIEGLSNLAIRLRESPTEVIENINTFPVIGSDEVGHQLERLFNG